MLRGVSDFYTCLLLCLTDRYSEELQSYLWPRFRHILNLNVASVRDADPHKLGHIDTRPHYVSISGTIAINFSFSVVPSLRSLLLKFLLLL